MTSLEDVEDEEDEDEDCPWRSTVSIRCKATSSCPASSGLNVVVTTATVSPGWTGRGSTLGSLSGLSEARAPLEDDDDLPKGGCLGLFGNSSGRRGLRTLRCSSRPTSSWLGGGAGNIAKACATALLVASVSAEFAPAKEVVLVVNVEGGVVLAGAAGTGSGGAAGLVGTREGVGRRTGLSSRSITSALEGEGTAALGDGAGGGGDAEPPPSSLLSLSSRSITSTSVGLD